MQRQLRNLLPDMGVPRQSDMDELRGRIDRLERPDRDWENSVAALRLIGWGWRSPLTFDPLPLKQYLIKTLQNLPDRPTWVRVILENPAILQSVNLLITYPVVR